MVCCTAEVMLRCIRGGGKESFDGALGSWWCWSVPLVEWKHIKMHGGLYRRHGC
jgi:hypothetical protein